MIKKNTLLLLSIIIAGSLLAQQKEAKQIATGFEAMKWTWQMPVIFPNGTETKQHASYDADGKNWDHNFDAAFVKYIDTLVMPDGKIVKEYVIFDEYGPGCLFRQHFNPWFDRSGIPNGWLPVGELNQPRADANIRYYFDNEKTPQIDVKLSDFFNGNIAPFDTPLCFPDTVRLFSILYYPFTYNQRLKVTLRPNSPSFEQMDTKWYQYTTISYPANFKLDTWKGKQTDDLGVREVWLKSGENPNNLNGAKTYNTSLTIKKNETKTVLKIKQAGSIAGLRLNIFPYSKEIFFNTNIKVFWDNSKEAAIDLPLGYFFGGGAKEFGTADKVFEKSLTTLFFGFDKEKGLLYSYFPMPFWNSAEIIIENNSGTDITSLLCEAKFIPSSKILYNKEQTGYFYAKRTVDSDPDTTAYSNVLFYEEGRGHVVAITYYTDQYDMDGDEFTYIDGNHNPQIHGNGTEDDHNQGWAGRGYQKPLWGGIFNGYNGAYRIYQNDSYIFNNEILISFEHSLTKKHFINGGTTDAVVFYYKHKGGSNLILTDEIDVGNHFSEVNHSYKIVGQTWKGSLVDAYDGFERNTDYGTYFDDGKAFNSSSSFIVSIDKKNDGIKLRKRINRTNNGKQTALVFVDGILVKERPWHIVTSSISTGKGKFDGWFDSDFNIPAYYTKGKNKVTVEIKYADSMNKEINEFYYWVYSYIK